MPDHGPVRRSIGYEVDPPLPDFEAQVAVPANVALGHGLQVAGLPSLVGEGEDRLQGLCTAGAYVPSAGRRPALRPCRAGLEAAAQARVGTRPAAARPSPPPTGLRRNSCFPASR